MSALYAKDNDAKSPPQGKAGSASPAPFADGTKAAYQTMSASAVGLELGIAVILGLAVGNWLDGRAGTGPWLTLLFLGCGFAAGMKGVFRAVRVADRHAARAEAHAAGVAAHAIADAAHASAHATHEADTTHNQILRREVES